MSLSIENILLVGSLLLLLSIIAGKTSFKFGIPTLLLFLIIGMLAGSEGPGGIYFDDPRIAQFIGIVSLNFILFSGGLDTHWPSIRPVLKQGMALSTAGVLLTAVGLGAVTYFITDFTMYESLLLGAIVSSTDAAAVFSILRSRSLSLRSNLRPTLELESGSNDPMAYVLVIAFLSLVQQPDQDLADVLLLFFTQMLLGAVGGYAFGRISKLIINRLNLDFEGLYPVLVIALMFITFSLTDAAGGNGFLAIYICAVYLGNQELIHKKTILKVFDGLAWLMQIVLFLTLGLLVFPSEIVPIMGLGLLLALVLIFLARPLAVLVSLAPFKMAMRRRLYISWVGLRGAVPIVFATYPLLAGISQAHVIFNLVFFISLSSVVLQGTSLGLVARWLGVALPGQSHAPASTDAWLRDFPKAQMRRFTVPAHSPSIDRRIVDLAFPDQAFIAVIERKGLYLRPGGSTPLKAGDVLTVLADDAACFSRVGEILSC